ncbi:hypothetical protein [Pseudomonas sp. MH9.3]|uniref:hypothetical protein n=1 Tax=Pseudomonas sp. MH9.3 TaxID=3048630 RepID=UPI002AC8AFFF|nr:hypothetical protein [Pseudomonas sp. MH9.3]MEB0106046.1 hypothetical protein [Pseudomonas sp. MH9.3]WPX78018.1 hypothetical protein RHM60_17415 [Pseudomonas sp. MH9.3]WQG59333.1 hypothetical protein RHM66_09105 [Pseudomonas sp. RTB3]
MKSVLNTVRTRIAGGIAIPAAGFSGFATIGSLMGMLLSTENRTVNVFQFFLVALSILCLAIWHLVRQQRRAKAFVVSVNQKEGLNFDNTQLLGYPSPIFVVFDHSSRKLAQCQSDTGDYQLRDFSWVIGWRCEWREVDTVEMGGSARVVNVTGMSVPSFERTRRFKDFALVLEVADASHPSLSFPMSQRAAQEWCTRCNALFHC